MTSNREHFSSGGNGGSSTSRGNRGSNISKSSSLHGQSNNNNHSKNKSQQQQQQQSSTSSSATKSAPPECYGCHKPILERYFLKALDQIWHEDCLKCSCCNCRLGEIGSTLFHKADLILCKRDYLRMFGATGFCSLCNKQIPAFEMVMRARGNVYHLECFKCEACNHRFCVGDRFYLHDNKILCEYDYEEQMALNQLHQQQQHQALAPPHQYYNPHQPTPMTNSQNHGGPSLHHHHIQSPTSTTAVTATNHSSPEPKSMMMTSPNAHQCNENECLKMKQQQQQQQQQLHHQNQITPTSLSIIGHNGF